MKILVFSDIHGDLTTLEKLIDTEADYYVAAGDMVSWRRGLDRVGAILQRKASQVFVMPGNHESERDTGQMCEQFGLTHLHSTAVEVGGHHLIGLGYSNPTPFDTPGEYSESEIKSRLAAFSGRKPMILVCHCPPKNSKLDEATTGHFGSTSIREFIEAEQPPYFFCGHIHEAEGVQEQIGQTVGVNVGKRGYLLEI